MVRSLNMLSYELSESYKASFKVTDSIDIRLLKTWVKEARATLIKQRLDEPMSVIDEAIVQSLGAVTFAPVDSSLYATLSGKYLMRSTAKIPNTINRRGNLATFTRIAPADRLEKAFNFTTYNRALVSGNGKFNHNDIFVFLDEGYLNLISKTNIHKYITKVHVKGVFANPEDAYTFNTAVSGVTPWSDDLEYPISEALVADLQTMIKDKNFKWIITPTEDKNSNGTDDIVNPTNKR